MEMTSEKPVFTAELGPGNLDRERFQEMFRRPGGLEMEIGCGKGRFILQCAGDLPETDFIAIERANRFYKVALERANRRQLANLRLIRADALEVLASCVVPGSLRALHVLFPDPWPKKRHHKRRLIQPTFLDATEAALADGGTLNVATDHGDYFEVIAGLLAARTSLERQSEYQLLDRLPAGATGFTNYEVKYRKMGREIHQVSWRRRSRAEMKQPG